MNEEGKRVFSQFFYVWPIRLHTKPEIGRVRIVKYLIAGHSWRWVVWSTRIAGRNCPEGAGDLERNEGGRGKCPKVLGLESKLPT